jgi:glycosyltransferase involved in cell wall biosynthesis
MNIVFLVNALEGGGAERVVLTLVEGFVKENHTVHLILVYKNNDYVLPDNVKVYYLLNKKPLGLINKTLSIFKASIELKKILKTISDIKDIDLFTSHLPLSNYIAWLAGVSNHFAVIHSAYSKKYTTFLKKSIIKRIHKNKKLIAVSYGIKKDLIFHFDLDHSNITTIYNPFDIDTIKKESNQIVEYDKPYIIHVGRLTKLKRHDLLIKAYSKSLLSKKYNLLLLGDGEEKENILSLINELKLKDKVILLGWQINPYKWINKAKLLLLTSDYEGLPTVLIESLICGTPVVSVDCDYGPNEILTGDLAPFLVPINNEKELTKIMEKAIFDYPEIKEDMYEKFSINNILNEYSKLSANHKKGNK